MRVAFDPLDLAVVNLDPDRTANCAHSAHAEYRGSSAHFLPPKSISKWFYRGSFAAIISTEDTLSPCYGMRGMLQRNRRNFHHLPSSGSVCSNDFPRFPVGLRANWGRCRVVHGGDRRFAAKRPAREATRTSWNGLRAAAAAMPNEKGFPAGAIERQPALAECEKVRASCN